MGTGKATKQKRNKAAKETNLYQAAFNKAVSQNKTLLGHLLVICNDPNSEKAKEIIEHYRKVLSNIKNEAINPDSNTGEPGAIIPLTTPQTDLPN